MRGSLVCRITFRFASEAHCDRLELGSSFSSWYLFKFPWSSFELHVFTAEQLGHCENFDLLFVL